MEISDASDFLVVHSTTSGKKFDNDIDCNINNDNDIIVLLLHMHVH